MRMTGSLTYHLSIESVSISCLPSIQVSIDFELLCSIQLWVEFSSVPPSETSDSKHPPQERWISRCCIIDPDGNSGFTKSPHSFEPMMPAGDDQVTIRKACCRNRFG